MVMETSNTYDYYNKQGNQQNGTPALPVFLPKYREAMQQMGMSSTLVTTLFLPLHLRLKMRNFVGYRSSSD
jgi:hypothetical protein